MIDPWLTLPFHPPHNRMAPERRLAAVGRAYPMLIDGRDLEKAVKQAARGHYFKEWLAAVTLFNRYGYQSLFGQHSSPSAMSGRRTLSIESRPLKYGESFAIRSVSDALALPTCSSIQRTARKWFVAEVKGWTEQVQPNQLRLFKALGQVMDEPVRVIRLRKTAKSASTAALIMRNLWPTATGYNPGSGRSSPHLSLEGRRR